MTPAERLAELRARAAVRRTTMPDYPDTDDDIAELAAISEALQPWQARTRAWLDEEDR